MGRLKALEPRLATLRVYKIKQPEGRKEYDQHRNQQAWRKWYKTDRWRKLRWSILVRDLFKCQMCGRSEIDTSKLVADHKIKHGGDAERFWDADGLQTLCSQCHSGAKQRQDNATR